VRGGWRAGAAGGGSGDDVSWAASWPPAGFDPRSRWYAMSTPTCAARAPRVPGPELIDVKVGYGAKIPVYRRTACPVDVRLDEGHVRQPRRYRSGARPAARPATSIERADPGRPPGPGAAF